MSSDYSGSFTPADSESFDKTFSGTGIETGPGWDASGTSSYDLPPDLALPPLEVPSLGRCVSNCFFDLHLVLKACLHQWAQ